MNMNVVMEHGGLAGHRAEAARFAVPDEHIGIRDLSDAELEAVSGGVLPLVVVGAALLLSGCAATSVTVGVEVDGVGSAEVEVKRDKKEDCPD